MLMREGRTKGIDCVQPTAPNNEIFKFGFLIFKFGIRSSGAPLRFKKKLQRFSVISQSYVRIVNDNHFVSILSRSKYAPRTHAIWGQAPSFNFGLIHVLLLDGVFSFLLYYLVPLCHARICRSHELSTRTLLTGNEILVTPAEEFFYKR